MFFFSRKYSGDCDDYNPLEDFSDDDTVFNSAGYPCLYMGSVCLGNNTIHSQVT